MIRIIGAVLVGGFLAALLFNGSSFAIFAGMAVAAVLVLTPLVTGVGALRCPACRKRIKLGATACHHCGRTVAEARARR